MARRTPSPSKAEPSGMLPQGVLPPRQERSKAVVEALLAAGRKLLVQRSLDELSVQDLCREIGRSIGVFYSRYENKDAYFVHVQHVVTEERWATFLRETEGLEAAQATVEEICRRVAEINIAGAYADRGVIRASLLLLNRKSDSWESFQRLGDRQRSRLRTVLAGRVDAPDAAARFDFAHQLMSRYIVQSILLDRDDRALLDPALARRLGRIMAAYINDAGQRD